MEDLLKEAQELQHKIVEWRRILHRYPETGLVLPKTADFVTKQLTAAGIAYKTYKNHSGITAVIGKGEGKTIAIRADMDGLPIKEETGLTYASANENMHACGHDAHAAELLATADVIEEVKTICWCGKKALCNARFDESGHVIKEGEQVVLGANDKYIGLCRKHWKEGNLGPQ